MAKKKNQRAVVLLSGGLDSATVLYYALAKGYECHCLLFDYGQRHKKELLAAGRLARRAQCPYHVITVKLPWGGSTLVGAATSAFSPKLRSSVTKDLPATYVPGRNTIFLSFALSFAETIAAGTVFIGANAIDYSGYPDCRPGYYRAFNRVMKELGTQVAIKAPLLRLDKAGIIKLGQKLGVPYELTWSCYAGGSRPCGKCDSCRFRAKGFKEAGMIDAAQCR